MTVATRPMHLALENGSRGLESVTPGLALSSAATVVDSFGLGLIAVELPPGAECPF